jgi:hypothetical protein
MRRCTVGEYLRTSGTKREEIGLSWNGPISPTIQGRMKKVEYSRMSYGGTSGVPGLFVALLTSRGSASTRSRGSHLTPGKGFGLVKSLKSCGMWEGPKGPCINLEFGIALVLVLLSCKM